MLASCNQPIPLKKLMQIETILPGDKIESRVTYLGVGIAVSDGKSSFRRLVQNAVVAINTAKQAGSNSACVYEEAMQEDVHRNNRIRDLLLDTMKNDGFYMLYQPQIDIQKGTVSGTEALVRLKKERISPGLFIPVVEKEGFIRRIGRITTRLVIEQIVRWREAGEPLYPVSINYSSSQLGDAGYVDYLLQLMEVTPTSANVMEYVRIVQDKSLMRQVAQAAGSITAMVQEGGGAAGDMLEAAEQQIYAIRRGRSAQGMVTVGMVLGDVMSQLAELSANGSRTVPGLSTGLSAYGGASWAIFTLPLQCNPAR